MDAGATVPANEITISDRPSCVLEYLSGGVVDIFITVDAAANFRARGFTIDGANQTTPSGTLGNESNKNGCGISFDNDSMTGTRHPRVENVTFLNNPNEMLSHYAATYADTEA